MKIKLLINDVNITGRLSWWIKDIKFSAHRKIKPYVNKVRYKLFTSLIDSDKRSFFKWLDDNYSHEVWVVCFDRQQRVTPVKTSPTGIPGYPKCVNNDWDVTTMVSSPAGEIRWIKDNPEIAEKNLGKHALEKVEKEQAMRNSR